MNFDEIKDLVEKCEFGINDIDYTFGVVTDGRKIVLQAEYVDRDIVTGAPELQKTRKWLLSPVMTKSEIVQTVFKCCMTSMEHRAREAFKYRDKRIFGPHFDVDALHEICTDQRFDVRKDHV